MYKEFVIIIFKVFLKIEDIYYKEYRRNNKFYSNNRYVNEKNKIL